MADNSTVLREYLVALGFQVNETSAKKFDNRLAGWDTKAKSLARSLVGVSVAATAMVAQFAYSMEKLYYASRRTDSAVGSIQALEYGARQVGVSGNAMRGSLEAMARNLRSNPGLQGLLNSLGVRVQGRDMSDVLKDFVSQTKKMPFFIGAKYANLFGMDPDTLFMLQEGLDEMEKAGELRKQMARDMGVDSDAAAKASKDLANTWREVAERAGIFVDALMIEMLPTFQGMAKETASMLEAWSLAIKDSDDWLRIQDEGWRNFAGTVHGILQDWRAILREGNIGDRIAEGLGIKDTGGGVVLSKDVTDRLGLNESARDTVSGTNLGTGEKVQFKKKWLDRQYDKFMTWSGAKSHQGYDGDEASVDAATDYGAQRKMSEEQRVRETRRRTGLQGQPSSYAPSGQRGGYVYQPNAGAAGSLFARLEAQYNIPPGTLDRVWSAESSRGKNMLSPAGAKGHFGFMDGTAKDMGLKDPNDLEESANAAARYYSQLLKRFGGDNQKAAAAYNWGMGNVERKGLGAAPRETQNYMDKVAPVSVTQETNVTVHGVSSKEEVAGAVRQTVDESNAGVIRNIRARVVQ